MARIVVDPVTRIEGHLRIEAEVDGGRVSDAWSSGTMFRGLEMILRGRDPREAWIWAQRICGVCTTVHALASVRAVEDALGIEVPDNARLIRSLIAGSQNVQDHVIHFYHLHALDWVDVTLALEADPKKTSQLAQSISDWPNSNPEYFKGIKERIQGLVDSGQLSLFTSGYWGHPAYQLPPEANLMAVAHYIEALEWQRDFIRFHAVLGGKNPHLQTYLVGGMAASMDPNEPGATINPERITFLRQRLQSAREFVEKVYLPDVLAIAGFYKDWFGRGEGLGNFMAFGGYPAGRLNDPSTFFLPRGIILDRDLGTIHDFSPDRISEYITHSWYEYEDGDGAAKHPFEGETTPNYTGPEPPYDQLNTGEKYSWLKAPRYEDKPMEVGPLARMLVAYASGHERVRELVDDTLSKLDAGPEALFSTLGRVAARALEAQLMVEHLEGLLEELNQNMNSGDLQVHDGSMWNPDDWPAEVVSGVGTHEAPRGALSHWVVIEDREIRNYQAVVPTTWNAGPRDAQGQKGAYDASLLDTPVEDPEQPLEILRTVHSFDPCMACAVHVVDPCGTIRERVQVIEYEGAEGAAGGACSAGGGGREPHHPGLRVGGPDPGGPLDDLLSYRRPVVYGHLHPRPVHNRGRRRDADGDDAFSARRGGVRLYGGFSAPDLLVFRRQPIRPLEGVRTVQAGAPAGHPGDVEVLPVPHLEGARGDRSQPPRRHDVPRALRPVSRPDPDRLRPLRVGSRHPALADAVRLAPRPRQHPVHPPDPLPAHVPLLRLHHPPRLQRGPRRHRSQKRPDGQHLQRLQVHPRLAAPPGRRGRQRGPRTTAARKRDRRLSSVSSTLVLGLGNVIQSDDGAGVRVVRRLLKDPRVPPGVELLDGGTLGLELLSQVSGFSRLLILDAVDVGEPPGTLVRIGGEELHGLPGSCNVHQLGLADLLLALRLMDREPEDTVLLGVQPEKITVGENLSQTVEASLDRLLETVLAELQR